MRGDVPSSPVKDEAGPAPSRELFLVLAAVAVPLLWLSDRAVNIDEPLFLWLGEQIQRAPFDFFGFDVNWYGTAQPVYAVTRNPPLVGFLIAAAGDTSERGLHLLFLFPAGVAAWATWALARRFCGQGWPAALLAVGAPVFLVCANTVMSDVPMLALWLVALLCWVRGADGEGDGWLWCAGAVAALGVWTKFFAVALVPLLAAHAIFARLSPRRVVLPLCLPLLALAGLEVVMLKRYGAGAIGQALAEALHLEGIARPTLLRQWSEGLAFAGGCVTPTLVFLPWLWGWRVCAGAAVAVLGFVALSPGSLAAVGLPLAAGSSEAAVTSARWFALEFGLMSVGGLSLLALGLRELRSGVDADRVLLVLWLLGSFLFAAFVNWTNNGRSNLVLAPVAAILIMRRLSLRRVAARRTGPLLAGVACLAFAFVVAAADRAWSNGVRDAARELFARHGGEQTLWFHGHWGLQYYLQRQGARPVDWQVDTLQPGDRLIVASNNAESHHPGAASAELIDLLVWPATGWVQTQAKSRGASFNASTLGPVPFLVGPASADQYRVYRVRQPIRFERWFDWADREAASD